MKAIVIADDLTGAAEVAGAAFRIGASAEVHIGELYETDADVVAIDADTRSLAPGIAAEVVSRLAEQSMRAQGVVLMKKVDSILRGPVLAEIEAMSNATRLDRCLLVCGNPGKRRIVLNGHLYLDGVPLHATEFALDPVNPCHTSSVIDLLRSGSCLDLKSDEPLFDQRFRVVGPGEPLARGVSVASVVDRKQLQVFADRWFSESDSILAAGAAEFIEAVLGRCLGKRTQAIEYEHRDRMVNRGERALLISGTRVPNDDGWKLADIQGKSSLSLCAEQVCRVLAINSRVAIRAADVESDSPKSRLDKLTDIAERVISASKVSEVWIEGGNTASALLRKLRYHRFKAISNLADGVVALTSANVASPLFVVKPGSYSWPTRQRIEIPLTTSNSLRDTVP